MRRRNMKGNQRTDSKKWQQATSTVEWIMLQGFFIQVKYQIITFNKIVNPCQRTQSSLLLAMQVDWKNCKKNEKNQSRGWNQFI